MAKKNKHHPPSSPAALLSNKRRRIAPADESAVSSASATPSMATNKPSQSLVSAVATPASSTALAATTVHIVAGSKVQQKVRVALSTLSASNEVESCPGSAQDSTTDDAAGRASADEALHDVLLLQGRASAASKLITISEVVKRALDQQGRPWWAYTGVTGVLEPFDTPKRIPGGRRPEMDGGAPPGEQSEDSAEDQEDEAFETLYRGCINAAERVRNVPVLLLYLATKPVPALKALYGEQSSMA